MSRFFFLQFFFPFFFLLALPPDEPAVSGWTDTFPLHSSSHPAVLPPTAAFPSLEQTNNRKTKGRMTSFRPGRDKETETISEQKHTSTSFVTGK